MTKTVKTAKTVSAKTPSLAKASAILGKALIPAKAAKRAKAKPATKVNPNRIATVTLDNSQSYVVVTAPAGTVTFDRTRETAELRAAAIVGGSFSVVKALVAALPKRNAKLAQGVDSRNAPHSAKAVADQKVKPAKADKPAKAPKASKAKAPAKGTNRPYKLGKTANEARPDSWRHHLLTMVMTHGDTDSAKAAHAKSGKFSANKLDFNFAAAKGYIVWAK
jgi:hypothetical protein